MKISYAWLSEYFSDSLPPPSELAEIITMRAFEVEDIEEREDDSILDVKILPNRAHDCLSYVGLAREVAVLLDRPIKEPEWTFTGDERIKTGELLTLTVEDAKRCPRAMKRLAFDVVVGESPDWLKKKLAIYGQRSINTIVDITNLVMFETGQPVHAFDFDKIAGESVKNITVRFAREGEKIIALDGVTYDLTPEILVIADYVKPLDIAGIKGGAETAISFETKNVMLSVCNFDPIMIRKTARALGLESDASKRFEQGISPILAERAMNRLSSLIRQLAGGVVADDVLDIYPKHLVRTTAPYKIGVAVSEVNRLLGTSLETEDIDGILKRFSHAGFTFEKLKPCETVCELAVQYTGVPYKYGASVTFDSPEYFDCSSFVNYLYVQAGIALPRQTVDQFVFGLSIEKDDLRPGDVVFSKNHGADETSHIDRLNKDQPTLHTVSKDFLKGTSVTPLDHNGIYLGEGKIIHASGLWYKGQVVIEDLGDSPAFRNIVGYRRFVLTDEERFVVSVPAERLDLRAGNGFLVAGLREDLIEEIGRIYGYENISSMLPTESLPASLVSHLSQVFEIRVGLVTLGFSEVYTYAFVPQGDIEIENPIAIPKRYLRKSLKFGMEAALHENMKHAPLLGLEVIRIFEIGTVFETDGERTFLGIALAGNGKDFFERSAAEFRKVGQVLSRVFGQDLPLTVENEPGKSFAEIDLSAAITTSDVSKEVLELSKISTTGRFIPFSLYPFVLRDIAIFVPEGTVLGEVATSIHSAAGPLLIHSKVFDTWKKETPEGVRISYAFRLVFQSSEKTLSDEEVNARMIEVAESINSHEGWRVR